MSSQELCLDVNKTLLSNFAKDLNITLEDLQNKLILVSQHEDLINMALQINQVYKKNPNAFINFGEYGKNMAVKLKLDEQEMYNSLLVSAYHDLLINIVLQLKSINEKNK